MTSIYNYAIVHLEREVQRLSDELAEHKRLLRVAGMALAAASNRVDRESEIGQGVQVALEAIRKVA